MNKNQITEKLKNLAKHSALLEPTTEEKAKYTREFSAFLDLHSVHNTSLTPLSTPFFTHFGQSAFFPYQIALVVLFIASGSIVTLSENALPDTPLYLVKRQVNEQAMLYGTSFHPPLRASVDIELIERRLEEAERLILADKLTEDVSEELRTEIEERTNSLHSFIKNTKKEPANTETILKTTRDLKRTLGTHEIALGTFSESKTEETQRIATKLMATIATNEDETAALYKELGSDKTTGADTDALSRYQESLSVLTSLRSDILEAQQTIELEDQTFRTQTETLITETSGHEKHAYEAARRDDFVAAEAHIEMAIETAEKALSLTLLDEEM